MENEIDSVAFALDMAILVPKPTDMSDGKMITAFVEWVESNGWECIGSVREVSEEENQETNDE